MKRIVLTVTVILLTLIFAISAYSHDYTSNDFWQYASQWYDIDSSASQRIDSAQFRYVYLNYTKSTDTCFGLNIIINDNTKLSRSALLNTGFDVTFYNTSGECLDYFHVLAKEGTKQEKGVNGSFTATGEAINATKGSNYRFYAEYHSLSKLAQSDKIIAKVQLFDSEGFALLERGKELTVTVPRLSLEPTTTQKATKAGKSQKSKSSNSSKTDSAKKKMYYSSTTATRYKSKNYYSSGNTKSKVATTKADKSAQVEEENYNKADIVNLEENGSALNTKQVIAISAISVLAGCLIAVIVSLIIKKNKHNSSVDDKKL